MPSTQEWIDELKGISVLELSERIKALEEEFGVSATAVAAAAPAAAGGPDEDGAGEESTTVDVVLTEIGETSLMVSRKSPAFGSVSCSKERRWISIRWGTSIGVSRREKDLRVTGAA